MIPKICANHADLRLLYQKTTFHMFHNISRITQRVNDKRLPSTGLETSIFQYSKNLGTTTILEILNRPHFKITLAHRVATHRVRLSLQCAAFLFTHRRFSRSTICLLDHAALAPDNGPFNLFHFPTKGVYDGQGIYRPHRPLLYCSRLFIRHTSFGPTPNGTTRSRQRKPMTAPQPNRLCGFRKAKNDL